jgi:hypothetical protein
LAVRFAAGLFAFALRFFADACFLGWAILRG